MGNHWGKKNILLDRVEANIIGKGSFGVVYKGLLEGGKVAVKVINRHFNNQYWNKLQNETIVLDKSLKHPNIINILSYDDKFPPMPEIWIAMEICDDNLFGYVARRNLSVLETLDILWQGANGLAFLHEHHLVHRDVKPDNFLVLIGKSSVTIKVTDFSLSKDIEGLVESEVTSVHGNVHWLAPEMFNDQGLKAVNIRFKGSALQFIDVFSFGLVVFYVCVNKNGRENISEKYEVGFDVKRAIDVFQYFEDQWNVDILKHMITPMLKAMFDSKPLSRPAMTDVRDFFLSKLSIPKNALTPPEVEALESHNLEYCPNSGVTTLASGLPNHIFMDFSYNLACGSNSGVTTLAIGPNNHVFMDCSHDKLYMWKLDDKSYKQVWQKRRPLHLTSHSKKFILGESIISRDDDNITFCWDLELKQDGANTHLPKLGSILIGVLPPDTIVYSEKNGDGWQLVLYNKSTRTASTLTPPAPLKWQKWLSVGQHPALAWLVVCDWISHSLDIFDQSGDLRHHVKLNYLPGAWNAVTCTASHVIVREALTTTLHVHAWTGREVSSIDVKDVCKVPFGRNEGRVVSLGVADGNVLHVAVEDADNVSSLHAFTIV